HPLSVRLQVELCTGKRRRVRCQHTGERRLESGVELDRAIAIDAARGDLLLPTAAKRSDLRDEIVWRLRRRVRHELLEVRADRFARGDSIRAGDLVTLGVAREEFVARRSEPLPERF